MRNNQTIISITELYCGQFYCQHIHVFEAPYMAKNVIEKMVKEDLQRAQASIPGLTLIEEGTPMDMWNKKEGAFCYTIGTKEYKIVFYNITGESHVSDKEVVEALDGFVNSSRSALDYKKVAETISQEMHRYCQNELWKFIKKIIEAFAGARYDKRNETAHNQAERVLQFMEKENII